MSLKKRFTYHILDGEDWIVDHEENSEIDLCLPTGEFICSLLNDLNEEKNCWRDRALHKYLDVELEWVDI